MQVGELLQQARDTLRAAGVESAPLDARLLLMHATGWSQERLIGYPELEVPQAAEAAFQQLLTRRAAREPLAHLTGIKEFWGLEFAVTPATLIPRPESEALIELALKLGATKAPQTILDLGTGSGCLLLSLLYEWPHATGLGVDISQPALDCAAENAMNLGLQNRVHFNCSDWGEAIEEHFDLIISNPPYIPEADRADLQPEVGHFEPENALFAGAEGLDAYKKLAKTASCYLTKGGFVVLEAGAGQARSIQHIFQHAGWSNIDAQDDLLGIERALAFSRQEPQMHTAT